MQVSSILQYQDTKTDINVFHKCFFFFLIFFFLSIEYLVKGTQNRHKSNNKWNEL